GATCTIFAPLVVHGRVIGVLRLATAGSGRRYTDDDLSLAQEIAHHAALAIEDARLYRSSQSAISARDNLLSVVSHDLRNYLSTIRLSASVLARRAAPGDVRDKQIVDNIKASVTRMDQLIEALRDATMIETGHFTIDARREEVAPLVEEA